MIVDRLDLGPWLRREYTRYIACPAHRQALARMDFERAVDVAETCAVCLVQFRKNGET